MVIARGFVPPGRVLWLERQKLPPASARTPRFSITSARSTDGSDGGTVGPSTPSAGTPLQAPAGRRPGWASRGATERLVPHWSSAGAVIGGGMVVSRRMFADHVPDGQLYNLKQVGTTCRSCCSSHNT